MTNAIIQNGQVVADGLDFWSAVELFERRGLFHQMWGDCWICEYEPAVMPTRYARVWSN